MARLIKVPAKASMVIIREEFLAVTHGDACAAAILNWAERWAIYFQSQGRGPWIKGMNKADIGAALLGMFKRYEIQQALTMLRECGYIRVALDSKNAWDRKHMYAFDAERVQEAIDTYFSTIDDLQVDHRSSTSGSSIGHRLTIDQLPIDDRSSTGGRSTLEDQNLLQKASTETEDQKAAAEHARERAAAAAADSVTEQMRESSDFQPHPQPLSQGRGEIFKAGTDGATSTTPPSSAAPPLRTALSVYVANFGKAGDVVQRGIAAAVARYGEGVVISTMEKAAKKGGRTWSYVETMLADIPAAGAWLNGADATDRQSDLDGWDGTGSPFEYIRQLHQIGEVQP